MTSELTDFQPEILDRERRNLAVLPAASMTEQTGVENDDFGKTSQLGDGATTDLLEVAGVYLGEGEEDPVEDETIPLTQNQTTWLKTFVGEEDQAIDSFLELSTRQRHQVIENLGEVYSGLKVNGLNASNKKIRIEELTSLFEGQTYQEIGEKSGIEGKSALKRLKAVANALNKKLDREELVGLITGELTAESLIVKNDAGTNKERQARKTNLTPLQKGWYMKLFGEKSVDLKSLKQLNERQKDNLISLIGYRLEDCFWHEDPLKVDRRQEEVRLIIKGEAAEEIARKFKLDLGAFVREVCESADELHSSSSPDDLAGLLPSLRELDD